MCSKTGTAVAVFSSFSPFLQILFVLATAALWTVLEYIRSHVFTGLPWNLLGASQWKMASIIQIADITGVYGITFLIVLINASLFVLLLTLTGSVIPADSSLRTAFPMPTPRNRMEKGRNRDYRRPSALMFSLALAALASSYSFVKLRDYDKNREEGVLFHAGAVQPDLSQRRHGGEEPTKEALAVCTALSEELFGEGKQKPHTVIWPETAVPCPFNASLETSTLLRRELLRMIHAYDVPFLFGAIRLDKHPEKEELLIYNSALLWKKGNKLSSFDKVHIVPFGEYVPFGDSFPVLNRIVGMGRNLNRGTHFTPLELHGGVRAGISICYEDVFPYVSRNHVLNGANLLVTITNDAWYPTSFEPAQHFANSLFRAVECRLPFLRVGNMDYSCVISPTGQVIQALAEDEKGKADPSFRGRRSGVFSVYVPREYEPTFYVKYGDVFTGICLLLFLFLLAVALMNYKWVKSSLLDSFEPENTEDSGKQQ
ncbi:MAG: apolipoprotein N-acyltransferase [Lentisphaeria bacterium]|nr:apolipoprotein N-acyltransferase [Lentisphaeria bacterium]